MILYRVQASKGEDWVNRWCGTLAEAQMVKKDLDKIYDTVHIDQIEIPPGKEGVLAALNAAHLNRINWPGKEI